MSKRRLLLNENQLDITGISGSGTANVVAKFTSANSIGDSQIIDDGTKLQIQTSSLTRIEVASNGNVFIKTFSFANPSFATIDKTTGQIGRSPAIIASDKIGGRSYTFPQLGTANMNPNVTTGGAFGFGWYPYTGTTLFFALKGDTYKCEASGRIQTRNFVGGVLGVNITGVGSAGTTIALNTLNLGASTFYWKVNILTSPTVNDGIWTIYIEFSIWDNANNQLINRVYGDNLRTGFSGYAIKGPQIEFEFTEANANNALQLYSGYFKAYSPITEEI